MNKITKPKIVTIGATLLLVLLVAGMFIPASLAVGTMAMRMHSNRIWYGSGILG